MMDGGGLFQVLDPKARDNFDTYDHTVHELFGAEAAGELRSTLSAAYDDAVAAGPMPNQLKGPGASLANAHREFVAQWQASESAQTGPTFSSRLETSLKYVAKLVDGALNEATPKTLQSTSVRFTSEVAGLCWIVTLADPLCVVPSTIAISTFGKVFVGNFLASAGHQAIDDTAWSPATKSCLHGLLTIGKAGYDTFRLRGSLLDAKAFLNAPAIVDRIYYNSKAAAGFTGWVGGMRDHYTDLYRSTDPVTSGLIEACLTGLGIKFQAQRIGDAILDIISQRALAASEQQAVRDLFIDTKFTTDFLDFTPF